jgi:hypothetical protein
MQDGLLIADAYGVYRLYTVDTTGCWHYDTPCDQTCAEAGTAVAGFRPTNAYGPAEVRAARLGYRIRKR